MHRSDADSLLLSSTPHPAVVLLQLNRPDAKNALNLALRRQLDAALKAARDDPSLRAVVITGAGGIFAAGADIRAVAQLSASEIRASGLHHLWDTLSSFPKPIIAAVNGHALGAGNELAMSADIAIAGASALFGQPEIKVGIIPGAGGIQRLIQLIGRARAMRLLLTGELISGSTAFEWGLISEVVENSAVLPRALTYARCIAEFPAASAELIKSVARIGRDLPLSDALRLEQQAFWSLFGSHDQREGMAAFLEKRPPQFNRF